MALEPAPTTLNFNTTRDLIEWLPTGAADKLRALRQHAADLHALTVKFEDIKDASDARTVAAQRLKRLTDHPQEFGHHLDPSDARVVEQQKLVDKLTDEFNRLNERNEVNTAAWQAASQPLSAVESWLRDGRPAGTALVDHEVDVPKPLKGENGLLDQIEARRRRVRELRASLNRIASSPFPSAHCKIRMREMVETLAQQGAPSVSRLVELDGPVEFQTQRVQSEVHAERRSLAFTEVPDAVALVAWLHKDALVAALDREIASEADDKAALTHEARQKAEAEVQGDLLAVERDEAALVWRGLSERLPVEHRADCSPQAILQVRLVTAPRVEVNGTTPGYSWNIRR